MPVLCVCCDFVADSTPVTGLSTAGEIRAVLPPLDGVLAGLGNPCRVGPATWLVDTDRSPADVMAAVEGYVLDPGERVVVLPVDAANEWRVHSGAAGDPAADWLGERLKR